MPYKHVHNDTCSYEQDCYKKGKKKAIAERFFHASYLRVNKILIVKYRRKH